MLTQFWVFSYIHTQFVQIHTYIWFHTEELKQQCGVGCLSDMLSKMKNPLKSYACIFQHKHVIKFLSAFGTGINVKLGLECHHCWQGTTVRTLMYAVVPLTPSGVVYA